MPDSIQKPDNFQEYGVWLSAARGQDTSDKAQNYYDSVLNNAITQIRVSQFWTDLVHSRQILSDEYRISTGYPLFASAEVPEIRKKPFGSALSKSYRKNVLQNKLWPNPPTGGWVEPDSWISRIGDLVRTLIVASDLV